MTDISRESCDKAASILHWHGTLSRAQNGTTILTQDDAHAEMILALRAALDRAEADRDIARQMSAMECDKCGWSMKFPDIGCVYCGFHDLQAALDRAEADKAAAAEAMREACHAEVMEQAQISNTFGDSNSVRSLLIVANAILALPTPAPMTVRQAASAPEVAALIAAASLAWQGIVGEYGYQKARVNFGQLEDALDALAALAAMEAKL